MPPARRRVSYVIPPPSEPIPHLQLPPHGVPRNGAVGPLLIPYQSSPLTSPSHQDPIHPRHRLGVASLALDVSTQLVGRTAPEGILYTGGRDGLVMGWDLGLHMKRRTQRYGVFPGIGHVSARRWEIMTNWADDVIEEETDEEELRSDGDVLGEVVSRVRRRRTIVQRSIPEEEQWEIDVDALDVRKTSPPTTQFRQSAQLHSDWVNDILLCNQNQTLISASSDGTVRAWNPHAHENAVPLLEPTTIGMHEDYVRCLAHSRDQKWVASGSFDRTIKLWDLGAAGGSTPIPIVTLHPPEQSGPKASVYAIATDPAGSIITSGSPERVIRLWDPRSGRRIGKLVGHTDNIRAMLLSEDARYLLTGSADASVKLWSLSSQRCLHTFTHHTDSVWSLFSQHPTLEIFYSGDRSGFVCKVDVEGCADVSEGECVVLCQDNNERGSGHGAAEGVNAIAAVDDNLLWTASGSSSFKRWKVPARKAIRAANSREGAVLTESPPHTSDGSEAHDRRPGARTSVDFSFSVTGTPPRSASAHGTMRTSSPPPSRKGPRTSVSRSVTPSLPTAAETDTYVDREGEETWYGIPYESLVRLTSPNEAFSGFSGHGSFARGRDPEIATLYSAASIMSMPRLVRPMHSVLGSPSNAGQRNESLSPSEALQSRTRLVEETQTLHPGTRARTAFEEREFAADAVPYNHEPDEVVQGQHGLVRCAMLNDRVHVLTVDTAGEVAIWDIIRGACRGRYLSEDVAAASLCGSEASMSTDADSSKEKQRSPREALETVKERIEGEAVVQPWATVDTKTGVLTVHMNERCFEAEIYADEAGYGSDRRYGDEARLNIGKWVLRNLFNGFIREEQRLLARRTRDAEAARRLHRGTAPQHIDINGHGDSFEIARHTSFESPHPHNHGSQSPKSSSIVFSPHILPAVSPSVSASPRTPIPNSLPTGKRESALSPIPQSPSDQTPMPHGHLPRAQTVHNPSLSPLSSDYFSLNKRRGSLSTTSTGDEFGSYGSKESGPQTPSTPSGLMGRIRAFSRPGSKRQASEIGPATPGGTLLADVTPISGESSSKSLPRSPAQTLLAGPINPPPVTDAPTLPLSPKTSVIISEEALSGWTTLYRGDVASTSGDVRTLEEVMPMWLLEYLLVNRAPAVPITKISFVLLPFPHKDPTEQLPELLNTAQSKLTASRFLRVRKLTNHVQDKLDRIAGSHAPTSPNTPRSSFDGRSSSGMSPRPRAEDLYEIVCNDVVLPLDMTLAAVRQYIWRQAGELAMYYRRKTDTAQLPHRHHH